MSHVGQLVVCVDDGTVPSEWHRKDIQYDGVLDGLTKGVVYTIRDVYIDDIHNKEVVRLREIIRPMHWSMDVEPPYAGYRFRPVVETRLDVFREMLAPVPGVKQKECV